MILLALILVLLLVGFTGRWIKKYSGVLYVASAMLSIFTVYAIWTPLYKEAGELPRLLMSLLTHGTLASALFIVVMMIGALPKKHLLLRQAMQLRAELSILACILILGHNIAFGRNYFRLFFTSNELAPNYYWAALVSLLLIALMLPLFITSFPAVRKKMSGKAWKKLQKLAYPFYALLYLHVLLLHGVNTLEGQPIYIFSFAIYSVIFVSYTYLKVAMLARKSPKRLALATTAVLLLLALSSATLYTAHAFSRQEIQAVEVQIPSDLQWEGNLSDGIYSGRGKGYNDYVHVEVEVHNNTLTRILVTEHMEDEPYIYWTINGYIPNILRTQSLDVDVVADATATCIAIRKAVKQALSKAEIK